MQPRQWDVVSLTDGTHALVLQADLLDQFDRRIVAPLVPFKAFKPVEKLHLRFRLSRQDYIVVMDKMAAIPLKHIKSVEGSMKDREWDIRRALDLVFVGV